MLPPLVLLGKIDISFNLAQRVIFSKLAKVLDIVCESINSMTRTFSIKFAPNCCASIPNRFRIPLAFGAR